MSPTLSKSKYLRKWTEPTSLPSSLYQTTTPFLAGNLKCGHTLPPLSHCGRSCSPSRSGCRQLGYASSHLTSTTSHVLSFASLPQQTTRTGSPALGLRNLLDGWRGSGGGRARLCFDNVRSGGSPEIGTGADGQVGGRRVWLSAPRSIR